MPIVFPIITDDKQSYVTHDELNEAISQAELGGEIDLSDYVTNVELNTAVNNHDNNINSHNEIVTKVEDIQDKISPNASETNKLVDTAQLGSAVSSMSANLVTFDIDGNIFPTKADLNNATNFYFQGNVYTDIKEHDYAIVLEDESAPGEFQGLQSRYEYDGENWIYLFSYDMRFNSFELAALHSGINENDVAKIRSLDPKIYIEPQPDWNPENSIILTKYNTDVFPEFFPTVFGGVKSWIYGSKLTVPQDGYINTWVEMLFPGLFNDNNYEAPMWTLRINDAWIIADSLIPRREIETISNFRGAESSIPVKAGDVLQFGIICTSETFPLTNVEWLDSNITLYPKSSYVTDAVTDVFNNHVTNLDIHVTPAEKILLDDLNTLGIDNIVTEDELNDKIPATISDENPLITQTDLDNAIDGIYIDGAMIYQGTVNTVTDLDSIVTPEAGWYYQTLDSGSFYIYNGTEWKETSGLTNLSNYYKKTEVNSLIENQSTVFENEIKDILDDYKVNSGSVEWTKVWSGMSSVIGIDRTFDIPIPEDATEILVQARFAEKRANIFGLIPVTPLFLPGPDPLSFSDNTGYNCVDLTFDDNGESLSATVQFTSWNSCYIVGTEGVIIHGIYYRKITPAPIITYTTDPIIVADSIPDWETIEITDFSNSIDYGDQTGSSLWYNPITIDKDGFYNIHAWISFSITQFDETEVQIAVKINGTEVNSYKPFLSLTPGGTYGARSDTPFYKLKSGDIIQLGITQTPAQTIMYNSNSVFLRYFSYRDNVLPATETAFNNHTQNTDIHVTLEDKARWDAGGDGTGIAEETDPIWTAEKQYYATSTSVDSKIVTHNTDTTAHDNITSKVQNIQNTIPSIATATNKLITQNELTSGLNSVYVPGAMIYRGILPNEETIKAIENPAAGDYYQASDTGSFWIYNGTAWEETSGLTKFDGYTKEETDLIVENVSNQFEDEIKNILDEYSSQHGMDVNEWKSCLSENVTVTDTEYKDIILDVDLKDVGATEVLFFARTNNNNVSNLSTTSVSIPITDKFTPGPDLLPSEAGGTYNDCTIWFWTTETEISVAKLYFKDYRTVSLYGQECTISGVFYRSNKPNTVISYYKDPVILGGNAPDWTNGSSSVVSNLLPDTFENNVKTWGDEITLPNDGYYCIYVWLSSPTVLNTLLDAKISMQINGKQMTDVYVVHVSQTVYGNYGLRWVSPIVEARAGDKISIGLTQTTGAPITFSTNKSISLYYAPYRSNVLPAVEAAFNGHVQNTDIHVTSQEHEYLTNLIETNTNRILVTDNFTINYPNLSDINIWLENNNQIVISGQYIGGTDNLIITAPIGMGSKVNFIDNNSKLALGMPTTGTASIYPITITQEIDTNNTIITIPPEVNSFNLDYFI